VDRIRKLHSTRFCLQVLLHWPTFALKKALVSRPKKKLMNMNSSKKQEGFILVVVAVVLIVLIGFLAWPPM
jgi:hypothetical protein